MRDTTANDRRTLVCDAYTLSGWTPGARFGSATPRDLSRRLLSAQAVIGLPSLAVTIALVATSVPSVPRAGPLAALAFLALVAQYLPVHIPHANVSLGVGFLLAACLLAGPVVGGGVVAAVLLVWSLTRQRLPWFRPAKGLDWTGRAAHCSYSAGVGGLIYMGSTALALAVFRLRAPVASVTLESFGASVVLVVSVYLLQNLASLMAATLAGEDLKGQLRSAVPLAVLVEFVALPAALLLSVTLVHLGPGAFLLLAWLYLMATFLGWRSWHDREKLEHRLRDLELLHRAGVELGQGLELSDLVRRLHGVLREVRPFDGMILILEDPGEHLSQIFAFDGAGRRADLSGEDVVDTEGRPEGLFSEPNGGSVFIRDLEVAASAHVRLRLDYLVSSPPDDHETSLLETLCAQAGAALSNARLYRLANTDQLTGLAIRRYFERALRVEAARGEPFAVIMLDLDLFKRINDGLGHRVGDLVLQDLASILQGSLRVMDVAARYGGEEFVVLLPESSSPEAAAVAERIRRTLDQRKVAVDSQVVRYTASFGVASRADLETIGDPMEVVWKADQALLEAKRAGRNQVVTCAALGSRGQARRTRVGAVGTPDHRP